jgi:hypothetical protein
MVKQEEWMKETRVCQWHNIDICTYLNMHSKSGCTLLTTAITVKL